MTLSPDDLALLRQFETHEIPNQSFHHHEHVRVAWAYLNTLPFWEALERFRTALQSFAAAHGKSAVYHETVTCAYFVLINERLEKCGRTAKWEEFAAANPDLLEWRNTVLRQYYSQETLKSDLAKRVFIMPDRTFTQT